MSPAQMGVLLHHYGRRDMHPEASRAFYCLTVDELIGMGLLQVLDAVPMDESRFEVTEKGRAFVEALCAVPLPRLSWLVDWPAP